MSEARRNKFLFVDDYGMGGIWIYIYAENPSDVEKKYPALKYVQSKPEWLQKHETENSLREYYLEEESPDLDLYRQRNR